MRLQPSVAPVRLQLKRINSDIRIIWNILQEDIFSCGIFHSYTVVFEAVGDYKVVYVEDQVVAGNLIKDFLCDGNIRSFVLDYHFRLS